MNTLTITVSTTDSTAISHWRYISTDESVGTLFVAFVNGSVYRYDNCPTSMALGMVGQASVGRYFANTVKPYFGENFARLSVPEAALALNA